MVKDRGEEVVDLLDCFWWAFSCCPGVVAKDVEYDDVGFVVGGVSYSVIGLL